MNSVPEILLLAPPSEGQAVSPLSFIPYVAIFVVFYLLVFAPMRRKQKQHTEMLRELKAGDKVVTSGGIHGTIVGVTDEIVQLRIADQVKIEVSKGAVSGLRGTES